MRGGAGDDTLLVDSRADRVIETATGGVDTVIASGADGYWLPAGIEALVLTGAARSGVGNGAENLVRGSTGADRLYGLGGADTLDGGAGNDWLWGGLGADVLIVAPGAGDDIAFEFDWAEDEVVFTGGAVATGTQTAAGYLFTFGAGDSLLLRGIGPPPPDIIL